MLRSQRIGRCYHFLTLNHNSQKMAFFALLLFLTLDEGGDDSSCLRPCNGALSDLVYQENVPEIGSINPEIEFERFQKNSTIWQRSIDFGLFCP